MSPPPAPPARPASSAETYPFSPAVEEAVELAFPIAPHNTWDSFLRRAYDAQTKVLQAQANALLHRGTITVAEARELVEVQRNRLVTEIRSKLSPPGRLYSELLKPSNDLPTLEKLVKQKGSIEAVLQSVGKKPAGREQAGHGVAGRRPGVDCRGHLLHGDCHR